MEIKTKTIKSAVILSFFMLVLLTSCANLPQKATPTASGTDEENLIISNDNNIEPKDNNAPESSAPSIYEWEEPSGGPTVTPIVLGIERRGEEGVVILRTPYADSEPVYSGSGTYEMPSNPSYSSSPIVNNAVMTDSMELVNYNPVNGAVVLPGQALHLDVTLKNSGTTTWQTNYKIIDISASPMTIQKEYSLPYAVAPGGTAIVSIYMSAPSNMGTYTETFQIQDAYGAVFGRFDYGLTVGDFSYVTAIPTLTATITPTYYSADGITATPDSLAWMCIDPERSKLQDCYSFCVEYSDRDEFRYCFYDGQRYTTPVP
ncbi:MAG: hypothetical protein IJI41_07270 [Anaerolineaceae bacterium]|nr:hypothetical protein [Anaerolineaceae bacterium]